MGTLSALLAKKVYLVHKTAREFPLLISGDERTQLRAPPGHQSRVSGSSTILAEGTSPTVGPDSIPRETFRNSFTLLKARALLPKICVTYLYCLAKGTKRGRTTTRAKIAKTLTTLILGFRASLCTVMKTNIRNYTRPHHNKFHPHLPLPPKHTHTVFRPTSRSPTAGRSPMRRMQLRLVIITTFL